MKTLFCCTWNFTTKGLNCRGFAVNFTKILRRPILQNTCERLLLYLVQYTLPAQCLIYSNQSFHLQAKLCDWFLHEMQNFAEVR